MNNIDFHGIEEIWSSLSTSSLLWLTVTLAAYLFAQKLYKWSNWNSLLNPVAVSIVTVVILLMVTHTPYQTYFSGAQFIHFLLGPTTVALAVPLYDLRIQLAKNWLPILLGLFAGAVTAITSTVLIAGVLGASPETIISLAPKSVTTPIAMSIAEKLGGLPALSASLVVLTGVLGSICAGPLFLLLKVDSSSAKGFALGLSAHGMGTSRAFQIDATAGAYGSLAIGLTGLTTAILAPLLTPLLMKLFFYSISAESIRLIPLFFHSVMAASKEPLTSIPRDASSMTLTLNPSSAASNAVQLTQKSVAKPQTKTSVIPWDFSQTLKSVLVLRSASRKAE